MGTMASQITGVSIVYSTVCEDADQRKHQSSVSLALVRGIHRLVTGEFPAQRASNAQHISIWWRHHRISIIVDDIQFVEAKQSMNITSQYQCLALAWHHKLTYVSLWWYRNTRLEMAVLGDNSESAKDSYFHRVLCIKNIKYRMRTKMTHDSPRITIFWSLVKRFANDIHVTRENHWRIASLVAINRY